MTGPLTDPAPGVYAIPPGLPFAEHFARGFHARFAGASPETVARTTLMVNTRRALRSMEAALADLAPRPGVLPRLVLIPELHADPLDCPGIAPAIPPLRRHLRLTRLVERFLATAAGRGEAVAPPGSAPHLAEELALLLDRFHNAGLGLDTLDALAQGDGLEDDAAEHWRRTLRFVDIVRRTWPAIVAEEEGGALDPSARQTAVIAAKIAAWRDAPPTHPVIAAASTGSVGSTANLLAAIARLPRGAIVLPGFDPEVEPAIWTHAGPDHPTGIFRPLLARLDLEPAGVRLWVEAPASARRTMLAQALRPAPVTDSWHAAAPALREQAAEATAGLSLVEAESPRHEADAIAVAIREVLETPDRTVSLVTPDAALARRVTAALARFGVVPDDTLGRPLSLTPPAGAVRMLVGIAGGTADPVRIAALLQHPLVRPGTDRQTHLRHARAYERKVLRGVAPGRGAALPPWPKASDDEARWLARLGDDIEGVARPLRAGAPLVHLVRAVREAAARLSDDGTGPVIWEKAAGAALATLLADMATHADAYGEGPCRGFPQLLEAMLRGGQVRPEPHAPHPRVTIRGSREARVEGADLVILAALNDGVWPAAADPGPWLSRPMQAALGLPLPEHVVGLSAHDFLQGACQPQVILSRSRKIEGTPTVASRWLIRLETLLGGIGAEDALEAMRARGKRYTALADMLAQPEKPMCPARRPAPRPPAAARPREMSVTDVELLIRDAYAVYAKRILGLRPLEPLGRPPDARDRGNVFHDILEKFVARTATWPGPAAARQILGETADEVLQDSVPWPDLRRTWRARIERFADWFIECEAARRQDATPLAWERRGEMRLDLPGGPFRLTAKADRIDRLTDGAAAIYDYKSGSPPTKDQIDCGFSQQLHLQAAILETGGFEGLPAMQTSRGAYIGLTGSGDGGKETAVTIEAPDVVEHVRRLRDLLGAFDAGAPYVSLGRPHLASAAGDYDHLARRAEWWGEEE